jgi:hypothetical protein
LVLLLGSHPKDGVIISQTWCYYIPKMVLSFPKLGVINQILKSLKALSNNRFSDREKLLLNVFKQFKYIQTSRARDAQPKMPDGAFSIFLLKTIHNLVPLR